MINERWPAHARFHGVTALAMTTALSSANIWSIWSGERDQVATRFFAAAVPRGVLGAVHPGSLGSRYRG
jgi:hypothetical protein